MKALPIACALSLLAGCVAAGAGVPAGTYADPSGAEHVTVRDAEVSFHVRIGGADSERFLTRDYPGLHVRPDGAIWPRGIASAEAPHFLGRVSWRWTGTRIERTDRETGEITAFTRRDR